jgi:precorrin-3B C17-methyltransferase
VRGCSASGRTDGQASYSEEKNTQCHARGGGELSIVSLGPGSPDHTTSRARQALDKAQVIVGYKTYISLIQPVIKNQEIVSTGMKGEMERCKIAIERAREGEKVAVVSSGDAGIYGMAGLILEMLQSNNVQTKRLGENGTADVRIEIIPGTPALAAAASLLGAPLMHDFASISLSDLLTPWELIEKRIRLTAEGDFVIALYNPRSGKRDWQLSRAVEIVLEHRRPTTPAGIVRRAMREGQEIILSTLGTLPEDRVDMQSIVIIGNSTTITYDGFMITPRGYMEKYGED